MANRGHHFPFASPYRPEQPLLEEQKMRQLFEPKVTKIHIFSLIRTSEYYTIYAYKFQYLCFMFGFKATDDKQHDGNKHDKER